MKLSRKKEVPFIECQGTNLSTLQHFIKQSFYAVAQHTQRVSAVNDFRKVFYREIKQIKKMCIIH